MMANISMRPARDYVDPVLSSDFDPQSLKELTRSFPAYYQKITTQCSVALKTYKLLLSLQYQTNAWEFATLRASVNLNFNYSKGNNTSTNSTNPRAFDIKIAKKVLEKCESIDDELTSKHAVKIKQLINFIKNLSVEEYISDPGALLLKVYFKVLNLKNSLGEQLNIAYTKAKLLVIAYELGQIMEMIDEEENPVALDNTDFQSTLNSYKDFVSVLIGQLDRAIADKDSDQIEECLGILSDVEKMYESVRMNFFFTEEFNEWEQEQQEQMLLQNASVYTESTTSSPRTDDFDESYQMSRFLNEKPSTPVQHNRMSRRGSISSNTSSMAFSRSGTTTISEELPYLMQAFDEARVLEQELHTYQQQATPKRAASRQPSMRNMVPTTSKPRATTSAPSLTPSASTVPRTPLTTLAQPEQPKSQLQAGITTSNMGFSSNLLNKLYGLHPTSTPFSPSNLHNEVD